MNLSLLVADIQAHPAVHWFDMVSGVIVAVIVLIILIELILMIPDFIRTVKIHMM
ncbi:MAG TPA: hypothetical protein VGN88_01435 [Phycisphaerae bacterium]|jgi:hypothetical protein